MSLTREKRNGGRHISISNIHEAALLRLVAELREVYPEKKVNASSTIEWMIEKICGKTDEPLKEYIEARNRLLKFNK